MDDYERALKRATIRALGISEPPYRLDVESDVTSIVVKLVDTSINPQGAFGGTYIAGNVFSEDVDDPQKLAQRAADEFRPLVEAHEKKKKAG